MLDEESAELIRFGCIGAGQRYQIVIFLVRRCMNHERSAHAVYHPHVTNDFEIPVMPINLEMWYGHSGSLHGEQALADVSIGGQVPLKGPGVAIPHLEIYR